MTKKRQRVVNTAAEAATTTSTASSRRLSSTAAMINSSLSDKTLTQASQKPCPHSSTGAAAFNDSTSADVVLRLFVEPSPLDLDELESPSETESEVFLYLHSHVLRRSKYFAALLSDRWQKDRGADGHDIVGESDEELIRINLGVPPTIESGITVLELLYSGDFFNTINSASMALDLLPVALELLFEECVRSCVRFLEAVPWTEEEEKRVMSMIPLLGGEESKELLARVSPGGNDSSEEMLYSLIVAAIHSPPNMALVKAFVAKLLRDFSSKESAKRVLERAFDASLKVVKESMEEYSSPTFRGDNNETEAMQRLNLHTAMTNGRQLLWLVERMIELKVADTAVKEWSEQASLTSDLQRAFRDDAWRNLVPGLPVVVLRSTCKLANAVATGSILAATQVNVSCLLC
ncbi:BTB/POZ domain-containing protein At1g63850-like isoform X3 [Humulus lupulus]|uniref:BTB/POZ domain-containing protein At1g63850-like isoform X3 n=1 Tax=Humulus lupulus TaxID=3486 RepID=UPI002B404CDA|nr:BTB/POZ domain-containing protein At1g63850-like isoform X3 [Humulus lupulus]